MASKETQSVLFTCELCDYESLVEDSNMSLSPNGPLSDSNYGSNSSYYSSPLGSEMGLPETENQDEVVLTELTRRMAEFTFEDDEDKDDDVQSRKTSADTFSHENYEAMGGYGGYKSSSSVCDYNHAFINASKQPTTADSGPPQNPTCASDIFSLQIIRMGNKPHVRKEGSECGGRRVKTAELKEKEHHCRNMQDRKAWKSSKSGSSPDVPLPVGGSGMRAVFLGVSNKINSVSTGTGVFLPSTVYSKAVPKTKTGCSTVIIPARVLQTLQQHFNNVGAKSQSQNSDASINHHWQNDVLARINGLLSQRQEQAVFQIQPPPANTNDQEELRLPHEWTY